eukprot:g77036.t1
MAAFLTDEFYLFDRDRSNSEMGVLLLLENDESAHHDKTACDLARTIEVDTALRKGGSVRDEGHIVWIRFNPHLFYVNNDLFNPSPDERYKKLKELLDDVKNRKLALHPAKTSIDVYYDRITVDDDEMPAEYEKLPAIFGKEMNSPVNFPFIDMLKDFVIKVV